MLNANEINKAALAAIPALRRVFRGMGLPADQVDDALQDAYIHLVTKALPRWRGDGSLTSFIRTAAKRRWIDTRRTTAHRVSKLKQSIPSEREDVGSDLTEQIIDRDATLAVSRVVELAALNKAMAALDGRERALVEAYRQTGELKAAAELAGMSPATATRVFRRVVPRLRAMLAE